MTKKYVELFLSEGNIKKEKEFTNKDGKTFKKLAVAVPKLGIVWVNKKQVMQYLPKYKKEKSVRVDKETGEKKPYKKTAKLTLGLDTTYEFYKNKNAAKQKITGEEIYNFFQENRLGNDKYSVARIVEKQLSPKNENVEIVKDEPVETHVNAQVAAGR